MEQDCCRICLSNTQSTERQDLFVEEQSNLSTVGQLYEEVLNIPIANGEMMLRYICNSCDLQLKLFKQLRNKALETHLLLTKILSSNPPKDEHSIEHEENSLITEYIECDDNENDQQEDAFAKIEIEDEIIFEENVDNTQITEFIECTELQENDTTTAIEPEPETENEIFQQQQEHEDLHSVEEFTENEAHCFGTSDEEYEVSYLDEEKTFENFDKEISIDEYDEERLVDEEDILEIRRKPKIYQDIEIGRKPKRYQEYSCPHCSEIFQVQSQLRRHKRSMHGTTNKIECEICKKVLLSQETYQAHINIHNGLPAYQCDVCEKSFNQKVHYTYHMLNHKNERNIICDVCQKGFISKSDLKTHMRSHTDERRYKCDICEKLFRAHTHMINHRYSHFEKQFECPECFQKYISPNTLRTHFKAVHNGEVPFECSFCEKKFKRKHHLQAHYKTHSKAMETMQIDEIIAS